MASSLRLGRRARRVARSALPVAGVVVLGCLLWWLAGPRGRADTPHQGAHRLAPLSSLRQGEGGPASLAGVRAVALSPDGRRGWVAAEDSGEVSILDLTGAPRVVGAVPAAGVRDLALLPASRLLIGATGSALRVWQVEADALVELEPVGPGAAGLAVGEVAGEEMLLSVADGIARAWRPSSDGLTPGPLLTHPDLAGARSAAFGAAGRIYVAAFDADALVALQLGARALRRVGALRDGPGLDGPDAVAVAPDGTVVVASYCGHILTRWRESEGHFELLFTSIPMAPGRCGPVPGLTQANDVLHPSGLAILDDGRVAVTGLGALLSVRLYTLTSDGALVGDGGLVEQPDWLDYARFDWAAPENLGAGPPLPPDVRRWRGRADVATNGADLLVGGLLPDAVAWMPAGGDAAFLHKGTGGARHLAGAYNLEIAADGASVYVAPRADPELVLGGLALDAQGGLSPLDVEALQPEEVGAGAMLNLTTSPDGLHVYAVDADFGGLHAYARSREGALERAARQQIPDCAGRPPMAVDVLVSADNRQLYVADFQWEGESCVHRFDLDAGGMPGAVAQTLAHAELSGVEALAETPDGGELLAACHLSRSVVRLTRNGRTGALSLGPVTRRDDLAGAEFVVVSPDGRNAYASSPVEDTVVVLDRDPSSGDLSWHQTLSADDGLPLTDAAGLAVTDDGQHLLVAARISGAVSLFARDGSGALTFEDAVQQGEDGVTGLSWVNGVGTHQGLVVTAAVADGAVSTFRIAPAE